MTAFFFHDDFRDESCKDECTKEPRAVGNQASGGSLPESAGTNVLRVESFSRAAAS
jgi:hypothetical protein